MEFSEFSSFDSLSLPCWLVVSKSDLAIHPSLIKELEKTLNEMIGGTHIAYFLNSGNHRNEHPP